MATSSDNISARLALVVVADPVVRQLCCEMLSNAGFAVANSIKSGADAVVRARELCPDVILLSQQLSDVPALEAIKWLRSNRESAATPIIMLGGKAADTQHEAGVTVLPRTVTASNLRIALIDALGHKGRTP